MAKQRRKTNSKSKALNAVIVALLFILVLLLYKNNSLTSSGELSVHFLDVGQADCILLQSNKGNVLIDGGENATESYVIEYIRSMGINKIDYVIATHPHNDHIGGLDGVILAYDVRAVIMPEAINTTTSYEKLLNALSTKKLKPIAPKAGAKFMAGEMEFTIIAPNSSEYNDLNNYSVGLRMKYGSTTFLFTGDAEALSENEILRNGLEISSDVYKAGHHGSQTSNTASFLDMVNPQICVISCGKDNEYNHPHKSVLDELFNRKINVLRTDEQGTIIIKSDGKKLTLLGN